MEKNIYLVYLDSKDESWFEPTVVAAFDNEENAKTYVEYCKEHKQKNERFYYVSIELNKMKDLVNWYKLTKD